jgi:hypothetical protein
MRFDLEILESFIPEHHKKSFQVFESFRLIGSLQSGYKIWAPYRAPFSENLSIDLSEYETRLKQKQREEKLNQIL